VRVTSFFICVFATLAAPAIARDVWVKAIVVGADKQDVRVHPSNLMKPYLVLSEKPLSVAKVFVASIMEPRGSSNRVRNELPLFLGRYPNNKGAGSLQWGTLDLSKGVLSPCVAGQFFGLGVNDDRTFAAVEVKCDGDNPAFNSFIVGMTMKNQIVVDAAVNMGDLTNMKMPNKTREYVGF
jgi:hypothetical protein